MRVTDTCRCGASTTIEDKYASQAGYRHQNWLEAHGECRKAASVPPPPVCPGGMFPLAPGFPPAVPTMPWLPDGITCDSTDSSNAVDFGQVRVKA